LFGEVQTEVGRQLLRDRAHRGVLYVGAGLIKKELPIVRQLDGIPPEFAFRVYVLGRRGDLDSHPGVTPVFIESDERLQRHEFLFWLSEQAAYALVQRRGLGATWGFHTCDAAVVEALVSKLQAEYDLQPY
jgi:hypothetical protein